jgi:hypothetical protein
MVNRRKSGATKEAQSKTLWEQAFRFCQSKRIITHAVLNKAREVCCSNDGGIFRYLGRGFKNPGFIESIRSIH